MTPKANTKNKEEEKRAGKSGKTSPPLSNSPQSKKKGKKGGDDISGIDKGEIGLKKERAEKPVILDIEPKPDVKLFYVEWLIN